MKLLLRQTIASDLSSEFFTASDRYSINVDNPDADDYSILFKLDPTNADNFLSDYQLDDGSYLYQFALAWPQEMTDFQRWTQTSNPLTEAIAGYTAIDIPYTE